MKQMTGMTRHHLNVTLQIEIAFSSSAQANTIMKALIPDNVAFPKGLSMKMFQKRSRLEIDLTSRNVPIATVIGTVDELLEHISVAKKVMSS
jgi:hypothetical protein